MILQPACWARGVSPYLPLNLSPEMERQIERVLILADKPITSRPIAAATVLDALPAACRVDEVLCRSVRRYLDRYMRKVGLGHAGVEIAATDGARQHHDVDGRVRVEPEDVLVHEHVAAARRVEEVEP